MDLTVRAAMALRASYGWRGTPTWPQLLEAAGDAGARVDATADLPEPIREAYIDGVAGVRSLIALRRGLVRPWQRWLLGHALGHHLLHRGNHFYLAAFEAGPDAEVVEEQEAEAEAFAGALLAGDSHRRLDSAERVIDLADWIDAPYPCVARWARLMGSTADEPPEIVPARSWAAARVADWRALTLALAALPVTRLAVAASVGLALRLHDVDLDGLADAAAGLLHVTGMVAG